MISAGNFEPNPFNEVLGPTSATKRPKTPKFEMSKARTPQAQTHIAEMNADKMAQEGPPGRPPPRNGLRIGLRG